MWWEIIIVVLIIILVIWLMQIQTKLIRGFWAMDEDFMQETGLTKFILFIDENLTDGYLMLAADEELYNGPIELDIRRQQWTIMDQCKYTFTMKGVEAFPENMTATFDPVAMSLMLHKDDKMFASLYKDRFTTKQAFETEKIRAPAKEESDSEE